MKKGLKIAFWVLFSAGVIALIAMVQQHQLATVAGDPEAIIHKVGEDVFITDEELVSMLKAEGLIYDGQTYEQLDTEEIEKYIRNISQVKSVEVFTRIGSEWKVDVNLREPIARVFNVFGESFYLDKDGYIVETSNRHTARVPVVTGEIKDRIDAASVPEIINNDSLISIQKLDDIYRISSYVCYDPVLRSLVSQIQLKKNGDFVLVPLVGSQKIVFGSACSDKEVREKFEKLKIFYREGMPNVGWNTYSEISLKYDNQIVCKKPSAE